MSRTTAETGLAVADRLAIEDVIHRYATGIDQRDWVLFRTCFTDDFTGEYGAFGDWSSGDAITEAMRASHATLGNTLHRCSNVVVS